MSEGEGERIVRLSPEEQASFLQAVSIYIRERVDRAIEQRMKDFRFVGPHEPEMKYNAGNFVVKGGLLWHCRTDTRMAPGETDCWVLVAKRGNDGKDANPNRVPTKPITRVG
jgi:hypothetical protein